MHQLRQIKDRVEAAGQVFREVAVLRRGQGLLRRGRKDFLSKPLSAYFSFQVERVKHFQQGDRRIPSAFPTARRSSSQCSMKEMTRSVMGSPKK